LACFFASFTGFATFAGFFGFFAGFPGRLSLTTSPVRLPPVVALGRLLVSGAGMSDSAMTSAHHSIGSCA
jgi:hypothetical protein